MRHGEKPRSPLAERFITSAQNFLAAGFQHHRNAIMDLGWQIDEIQSRHRMAVRVLRYEQQSIFVPFYMLADVDHNRKPDQVYLVRGPGARLCPRGVRNNGLVYFEMTAWFCWRFPMHLIM